MVGLGIFPESTSGLILPVLALLLIGFIWLLFEKPRAALNITEVFFKVLFMVVKAIVIALWAVASWIGRMISRLWR
jgi:cellulose synthase/poly-beta-1,6-N-acetylglucosamine synthase-like glycosyltransferase